MRLDVTGRRPWPGDLAEGYRVVLEGKEQPSPYGLADGEAAEYSPDGNRVVRAFGIRRVVTPKGGRPRHDLRELAIDRGGGLH